MYGKGRRHSWRSDAWAEPGPGAGSEVVANAALPIADLRCTAGPITPQLRVVIIAAAAIGGLFFWFFLPQTPTETAGVRIADWPDRHALCGTGLAAIPAHAGQPRSATFITPRTISALSWNLAPNGTSEEPSRRWLTLRARPPPNTWTRIGFRRECIL